VTAIGAVSTFRSYASSKVSALSIWHWTIFVFVAFFVLTPFFFLIIGSFSQASLPTDFSFSEMGWDNYLDVWSDPSTYAVFQNTFYYVTGATAFGITEHQCGAGVDQLVH
jgi:ABC-type glycerol-3-phosphate transport system permease component